MGDSKTSSIISAGAALIAITAVAMSSRVTARWLHKTMGWDDVLILMSWVCSISGNHRRTILLLIDGRLTMADTIIGNMLVCYATQYGLGRHRDEVNDENYNIYLKLQIASSITYSWGVPAAKASFAVLYLRIFPEGGFRFVNKILIGFLFAQAVEETCVVLFKCHPITKSWDFRLEGTCLDLHPLWYSTFVFNLITDLTLFIEPIPSTWKLQLPLAKRLGLITMLSLGLLVTSISVIRIVYVTGIGTDDTFQLAEPLVWSMVEICALIICSCIPSLRQVAAIIPGLNSALGLSSGGNSANYYNRSGQKPLSIPLQSRGRKEYIQSQRSKTRPAPFGMTSRVTATGMDGISENGSQDEIFPHKSDQSGVIMVTTEVEHQVESSAESSATKTDAASRHQEELNESLERSSRMSPTKKTSGDMNWLRRSK
ncbi:hypothetical protein F5Y04DRAFT_288421 [Hypomontagnella monticulosa]|nr:hypothetical protein F5Y04DRAFT_288421 [Hypomontagnella monticulosa]